MGVFRLVVSTTIAKWLSTCFLALAIEAFLQQPFSVLATGVLVYLDI